jgi:transposase
MRSEAKREEFARQVREIEPLTTDKAVTEPYGQWAKTLVALIRQLNTSINEFEKQIEELFDAHQDAELFKSLPGAGPALAPRIAAIFGTDRDQFADAEEIATVTGVAPVTKTSGNSTVIQKRLFCPKFLRQTWHEFAGLSIQSSRWAAAYYKLQRSRGKKHSAAVRSLAFKWIRILFRVWKTRTRYDEQRYLQQLRKTNSPLVQFLDTAA